MFVSHTMNIMKNFLVHSYFIFFQKLFKFQDITQPLDKQPFIINYSV